MNSGTSGVTGVSGTEEDALEDTEDSAMLEEELLLAGLLEAGLLEAGLLLAGLLEAGLLLAGLLEAGLLLVLLALLVEEESSPIWIPVAFHVAVAIKSEAEVAFIPAG